MTLRPSTLLDRVRTTIGQRGLTARAAAREIGVGLGTLDNHLRGEHVRSDSARKYEAWLSGRGANASVFTLPTAPVRPARETRLAALPSHPARPTLVVDVFAGCGGLSSGFDLLGDAGDQHRYFKTVLALDNQDAPIQVLNHNDVHGGSSAPVGRKVDLTDFANEAEVLTFYVEHAAQLHGDDAVLDQLNELCGGAYQAFRRSIDEADAAYLAALAQLRATDAFSQSLRLLDRQSLLQTSVIGFHDALRLPMPGRRAPLLPAILWGRADLGAFAASRSTAARQAPPAQLIAVAMGTWDEAIRVVEGKRDASGHGQLTASARRIRAFSDFLRSPGCAGLPSIWAKWRARRDAARETLFDSPEYKQGIRALYTNSYPVGVLVGGPPCQGFARIGRGKIRSLRDARVQVHQSTEAGDARNLLFQRYVMMIEALRPKVFVFENVQHFKSVVKLDGREFRATEVLADAIAGISEGALSYAVSSRVVDASRHGVPQTRQRFFMCGVRADGSESVAQESANQCLALPHVGEVPLSAALAGLPSPVLAGGDSQVRDAMAEKAAVFTEAAGQGAAGLYSRWIRQLPPRGGAPAFVDAHVARAARTDDAALFALMGPGKRWMDYRADDAATITELRAALTALLRMPGSKLEALNAGATGENQLERHRLEALRDRLDGSLPIRLLLEQIGARDGAEHHLLTATYLAKRDGHHGDWIARMDATKPAKTMVSHMGKDTYGYIHPSSPRTISAREAARIQTFPDWYSFAPVSLTDAFRMIGNAVPPMLSSLIAANVARVLAGTAMQEAPARRSRAAAG